MIRRAALLACLLLLSVALWMFEALMLPFRYRAASWPSRPNVEPWGVWYGWPWHSRMPSGTRRARGEWWLLRKRWDIAIAVLGRDRARPFDFIPF